MGKILTGRKGRKLGHVFWVISAFKLRDFSFDGQRGDHSIKTISKSIISV